MERDQTDKPSPAKKPVKESRSVWALTPLSGRQVSIVAMEDEARWMIKNNLTRGTRKPNFPDYIYEDSLKAVKSGSVNIIR